MSRSNSNKALSLTSFPISPIFQNNRVSRVIRMLQLFFQMVFLAHISGCLFSYTAIAAKTKNGGEWDPNSWVGRYAIGHEDNLDENIYDHLPRMYMVSFYWAITTLTTVGYGDIFPYTTQEMLLTVCIQFTGTMVFGYM